MKRKAAIAVVAAVIAAAACFAAAAFWQGVRDYGTVASVEAFKNAQDAEDPSTAEESAVDGGQGPQESERPSVDWAGLLAANPDVQAWVRVPGTRIDYPVVQASPEDPHRYLDWDIWGNRSYYGCPYVDCALSDKGGIDSTFPVVYGHSLINGLMFSDFQKYSDPQFAESHRIVLLSTPEEDIRLRVIAANVVDADTETIEVGFDDPEALTEYLEGKLAESEVVLESPERIGQAWCFVTCSYQTDNSRTLVYAVEEERKQR